MPKPKMDTEAKRLMAQIKGMLTNGDVKLEGSKPAQDFFISKLKRLAELADKKAE